MVKGLKVVRKSPLLSASQEDTCWIYPTDRDIDLLKFRAKGYRSRAEGVSQFRQILAAMRRLEIQKPLSKGVLESIDQTQQEKDKENPDYLSILNEYVELKFCGLEKDIPEGEIHQFKEKIYGLFLKGKLPTFALEALLDLKELGHDLKLSEPEKEFLENTLEIESGLGMYMRFKVKYMLSRLGLRAEVDDRDREDLSNLLDNFRGDGRKSFFGSLEYDGIRLANCFVFAQELFPQRKKTQEKKLPNVKEYS